MGKSDSMEWFNGTSQSPSHLFHIPYRTNFFCLYTFSFCKSKIAKQSLLLNWPIDNREILVMPGKTWAIVALACKAGASGKLPAVFAFNFFLFDSTTVVSLLCCIYFKNFRILFSYKIFWCTAICFHNDIVAREFWLGYRWSIHNGKRFTYFIVYIIRTLIRPNFSGGITLAAPHAVLQCRIILVAFCWSAALRTCVVT